MLDRFIEFEKHDEGYNVASGPSDVIVGGWIALETASYFPKGIHRNTYLSRARSRFDDIAKLADSANQVERIHSYNARLGLITLNAYSSPVDTVIEDTPGMYAEALEDLMADWYESGDRAIERRGLLGEMLVGAVCGSMELLALPASVRHDWPLGTERPSFAHDLQLWESTPASLPARPDKFLQVKTNTGGRQREFYSDRLTMVFTRETFRARPDQIAKHLINLYSGGHLSQPAHNTLTNARKDLRAVLNETVGHDTYKLRGAPMRRIHSKKK